MRMMRGCDWRGAKKHARFEWLELEQRISGDRVRHCELSLARTRLVANNERGCSYRMRRREGSNDCVASADRGELSGVGVIFLTGGAGGGAAQRIQSSARDA